MHAPNRTRLDRFWVTERRVYAARLAEEQKAAQGLGALEAQIADKSAQVRSAVRAVLWALEPVLRCGAVAPLPGVLMIRSMEVSSNERVNRTFAPPRSPPLRSG